MMNRVTETRRIPGAYPVLSVSLQGAVHELHGDSFILIQPLQNKLQKPPGGREREREWERMREREKQKDRRAERERKQEDGEKR